MLDNVKEGGLQQAEAGREQSPSAPRGGGWALRLVTFPRRRRHLSAEFRRLTWYNQLGQPTTSRLRAFPRGRRTPDVRDCFQILTEAAKCAASKISLWHMDYFELKPVKAQKTQEDLCPP